MPATDTGASARVASRQRIIERIEREAGVQGLASILARRLSPTDLQSLLLEVYRARVGTLNPQKLLESHVRNRFVRPSALPPENLLAWDSLAWSLLPEGFEALELAPVCPVGSVSVLAPLSQDWSVSTSRNTEVVSDSTNVLALECAARRSRLLRRNPVDPTRVHLAASHRLLRGQPFGEGPGTRQHFRLFALCSAGRDSGSLWFETEVTCQHITFFVKTLKRYLGPTIPLRVAVANLGEASREPSIETGVIDRLRTGVRGVKIDREDPTPAGRAYYRTLRFHIYGAHPVLGEKELVDGGAVDWGQRLLNNHKERMLISGLGTERLAELFGVSRARKETARAARKPTRATSIARGSS